MKKQIAKLVSNILNPYFIGSASLLIITFESANNVLDALKWAIIVISISLLPIYLAIVYLVRTGRIENISANIRWQRTIVYIVAVLVAGVDCIVLYCLGAPLILKALFLAAFLSGIIFMCINLWWKISLHVASIAGLVTILVILYGSIGTASVVLIPLMIWARVELKYHSPSQGITGAFLVSLSLILVFYLVGLT